MFASVRKLLWNPRNCENRRGSFSSIFESANKDVALDLNMYWRFVDLKSIGQFASKRAVEDWLKGLRSFDNAVMELIPYPILNLSSPAPPCEATTSGHLQMGPTPIFSLNDEVSAMWAHFKHWHPINIHTLLVGPNIVEHVVHPRDTEPVDLNPFLENSWDTVGWLSVTHKGPSRWHRFARADLND